MVENLGMSALAMRKSATNAEFSPEVLHISVQDGQDRKRRCRQRV